MVVVVLWFCRGECWNDVVWRETWSSMVVFSLVPSPSFFARREARGALRAFQRQKRGTGDEARLSYGSAGVSVGMMWCTCGGRHECGSLVVLWFCRGECWNNVVWRVRALNMIWLSYGSAGVCILE